MNTEGAIRMRAITSLGADTRAENDTLDTYVHIDSTMGYDDGVSDIGYGLTAAPSDVSNGVSIQFGQ